MDKSEKYYAEGKKLNTEEYILHNFISMEF